MPSVAASTLVSRCQTYSDSISGRVDTTTWRVYLNEWLRRSAQDYNLPWSRRTAQLMVFEDVWEYPVPTDYRNIIRPQVPISSSQNDDAWFLFQTHSDFARNRNARNDLAVAHQRDTAFFNIRYSGGLSNILLHDMEDLATDGSWAAAGAAGNLRQDQNAFRQGSASLSFDVATSGAATITNTTVVAKNLDGDEHRLRSTVFLDLFLPVTGATGVTLRWGSSATDYWSRTVTAAHNGAAFATGWQTLGFAWNGATETGTVDETSITYLQVSAAAAGVGNSYRVDNIISRVPKEFDLNYYSNTLVRTTGGAYQEAITADSDLVLGDTEYEDCAVFYAVAQAAKYTLKDGDLWKLATADFEGAFARLKSRHPDMSPRVQHSYFSDRLLGF